MGKKNPKVLQSTREHKQIQHKVLSREDFKKLVFARSKGLCVFCNKPAVDAHHILDRKLWKDGTAGYFLSNGAGLCSYHHLECEKTTISVEMVRQACCITNPILPNGFDPGITTDKWGNIILENGIRIPGPLFYDDGAQKILRKAGILGLFKMD